MARRSHIAVAGIFALALALAAPQATAGVDIKVDARTLTDLLSAMVPESLSLDLTADKSITLQIAEMKVTGFDPAAGNGGHILTSLRLESREIGLTMPLQPRLSLQLTEVDGRSVCNLRFEEVVLPIPLSGPVDIAGLLPEIPVPADELNTMETPRGVFRVRTRLVETLVGREALHFRFEVEVSPLAASP